ncbi:RdRP-domain-containing protein [Xylariaceae sp. FL1272]|nr:RdRP-domain-containing protein [Xylariaceae sp. FL1272]
MDATGYAAFMTNLPTTMTDLGFRTQLAPHMAKLRISDYQCQKSRGKTFGIVTFLHKTDGENFMNQHGSLPIPGLYHNGRPSLRARLYILNQPVRCTMSNKPPDAMLIRVLQKESEDRAHPDEDRGELKKHESVVFDTLGLSCGHYEYPNNAIAYAADVQWTEKGIAKFARDCLILKFPSDSRKIRVEIQYRAIVEVVISMRPPCLFVTLWEAPKIFEEDTLAQAMAVAMRIWGFSPARNTERARISSIPHAHIDHSRIIGQSLIYCIKLSPNDIEHKIGRLREKDFLTYSFHNIPNPIVGQTYMAQGLVEFEGQVARYGNIVPFDLLFQFQSLVQNGYLLPQTVGQLLRWLRDWIVRNGPQAARAVAKKPNDVTRDHDAKGTPLRLPFSAHAVKRLFKDIPFPGPNTDSSNFNAEELWDWLLECEKEISQGLTKELFSERARQNLTLVYKVQVTPSRVMISGPEPEAKNRILRKLIHARHTEYFARVQFCDEDGQDLQFNHKVSLDAIYARFNTILRHGFPIAGRMYMFLGFSHSSLRSHAVWFIATFMDENKELQSHITVIKKLGQFSEIRSPARCAARIGQSFSETPNAVDLHALGTRIEIVPDVKSKDGARVFSDGVGTISRELMEAIHKNLPPKAASATCFQIRWAGAKGMLSLDDTLDGLVMRIRPSMNKFDSDDKQNLEICDTANKPIPLVLNRQMIKILEDMRVPHSWFIGLQNKELERLRKITASTDNTVIFLKRQKIAEQMRFFMFIRRLQKLGLDYRKDTFLCSVVETAVLREVRLLKHKARIPVDQGVTLFGVMDEFGFLGDEEVFVTYDKRPRETYPDLHNRWLVITRSPALHPGDIQIRRAVVPPEDHPLRSLSNCIVFSQKGKRDLPSQLSGGDLDGDIYNVIWDNIPVDDSQFEFPPAEYPRVAPLDIGRTVTPEDMTEFFVKFMATDQLGLIAVKHIILADMHVAGTVHEGCKLLAEMHSTAVDYSKTGIPVDMTKLSTMQRTNYRPEFLAPAPPANLVDRTEIQFELPTAASDDEERDEDDDTGPRHKFYRSNKILGVLYNLIDEKRIWKEDIHVTVNRSGSSLWNELWGHIQKECLQLDEVDWKSSLDEARSIRHAYEDEVWAATNTFSDHATKTLQEIEVFTGAVFNKTGIQTRRQRDASVQLKDEFDRITKCSESLMTRQDTQTLDSLANILEYDGDSQVEEDISSQGTKSTGLELSIACFYVGMTEGGNRAGSTKRSRDDFESFKIVAAHCALRELEKAVKEKSIRDGVTELSGGYVGVR